MTSQSFVVVFRVGQRQVGRAAERRAPQSSASSACPLSDRQPTRFPASRLAGCWTVRDTLLLSP